jgi:hypothetical protein
VRAPALLAAFVAPVYPSGEGIWRLAGNRHAGHRAAAVETLVHAARLNGDDPRADLRDVLERLSLQQARRMGPSTAPRPGPSGHALGAGGTRIDGRHLQSRPHAVAIG